MDPYTLQYNYFRRFGVEMEVNTPDRVVGGMAGAPELARIVSRAVAATVKILPHGHNHYNEDWVVKPDSSCGMEVCSPLSKGHRDLGDICRVASALKGHGIPTDTRCSLHVHVEVSDCTPDEVVSILTCWIKCEPVFMDCVPSIRKNNQYCQVIGHWDWVQHDELYGTDELIRRLGHTKYTTMNCYHLYKGQRPSVEVRTAEHLLVVNPFSLKMWVRLLIHFVERAKRTGLPYPYQKGDPWSGYAWLDPADVLRLLGWDGKYHLSAGMRQVRDWFLARLLKYTCTSKASGRLLARKQAESLASGLDLKSALAPTNSDEAVYGDIYKF